MLSFSECTNCSCLVSGHTNKDRMQSFCFVGYGFGLFPAIQLLLTYATRASLQDNPRWIPLLLTCMMDTVLATENRSQFNLWKLESAQVGLGCLQSGLQII